MKETKDQKITRLETQIGTLQKVIEYYQIEEKQKQEQKLSRKKVASLGGKARAIKLSKEKRQEISRKGGNTKISKKRLKII